MSENDAEAFLMTTSDSMEADIIESLLKVNNIPVLRKYRESGGYMMIMMGNTIYGVDLYVPADMLDKAREIVDNSREASEDAAFPDNVRPEETTGEGMGEPGEDTGEPGWVPDGESGDTETTNGDMGEPGEIPIGEGEDMEEKDGVEEDATAPEARDADAHEEQYRLALENTDRRRRNRAWITLLFFILLILSVIMLAIYLNGLFAVQ